MYRRAFDVFEATFDLFCKIKKLRHHAEAVKNHLVALTGIEPVISP